ncbi:MAG: hypothetical protein ABI822_31085, partial [Bryobacteraceae bacterium]
SRTVLGGPRGAIPRGYLTMKRLVNTFSTFLLMGPERVGWDSGADDSRGANATMDHSDIRGWEPHGHHPGKCLPVTVRNRG